MMSDGRNSVDQPGFWDEWRRVARISGTVGNTAMRIAAEKLGLDVDRQIHAQDLKTVLGTLKGPLMKVAQLLSTIPNALPEEYARELSQLQSNAPPMGWGFVRRRMAAELGPEWQRHFSVFNPQASAAASLGQVHKATLHDNRVVACKLQYPHMQGSVETDLKQLRFIIALYHRFDNTVNQDEVCEELSDRLYEELDYEREIANIRLYRLMLEGIPHIRVPEPVTELSTQRLLTMQWLDGDLLHQEAIDRLSQEERNHVAAMLFKAWYIPFYQYGVIHGDPHTGNFLIDNDLSLALLDYGSIRIFKPSLVKGVIDLCQAIERNDDDMAYAAYRAWGFVNLSRDVVTVLNEWARFLYEPFLDDRIRGIQTVEDPQYGRQIASKVYEGLKKHGGIKLPREFVLVDRSAIGLGSAFVRLKAKLNWRQLFNDVADGFNVDLLGRRQEEMLRKAKIMDG